VIDVVIDVVICGVIDVMATKKPRQMTSHLPGHSFHAPLGMSGRSLCAALDAEHPPLDSMQSVEPDLLRSADFKST